VAYKEANSHPEPMIELSDAQIAPMSPISRFSPTSAGRVTEAALVSVAMIDSSFLVSIVPRGACHSRSEGSLQRVSLYISRVKNIVGTIYTLRKRSTDSVS
jgi:hypothetical protein